MKSLQGMRGGDSSTTSLSHGPRAKRLAPSRSINRGAPSTFQEQCFTQVMREYTVQKLSSFVTIQSVLLQMPNMFKELDNLHKGWNPSALIFDRMTAFEYAKKLIIEEDGKLSALEATKIVMEDYPSAFTGDHGDDDTEMRSFLLDALDDTSLRGMELNRESSILALELNRNSSIRNTMESNNNASLLDIMDGLSHDDETLSDFLGLDSDMDTNSLRSLVADQKITLGDFFGSKALKRGDGSSSLLPNSNTADGSSTSYREILESEDDGSFRQWLKLDFCNKEGSDPDLVQWFDANKDMSMCDLLAQDNPSLKDLLDSDVHVNSTDSLRDMLEATREPSHQKWCKEMASSDSSLKDFFDVMKRSFPSVCDGDIGIGEGQGEQKFAQEV